MAKNTITERINELFQTDIVDKTNEIKFLLERIHTNLVEAEQQVRRAVILLWLFWAVFYAISSGIVEEGQIASFKVQNVKVLIISGPPIMGVLLYFLLSSLGASVFFRHALSYMYKNLLPKAVELDLHNLMAPPTTLSLEMYVDADSVDGFLGFINFGFSILLLAVFLFLSIAIVCHVFYLVWSTDIFSTSVRIYSLGVGLFFSLRGCVLAAILMREDP